MNRDLTISLVQSSLFWQDTEANRKHLAKKINAISQNTDLIILPEMFTTGFSMNAALLAESMDGTTLRWMQDLAIQKDAVIVGSLIIQDHDLYYNRLIWMRPDGSLDFYDKRHLFAMAGEHNVYTAGSQRLIVTLHGWRICPMICYDLRFPVWSRNSDFYDLLIYIANWPDRRSYDWNTLLKARAIENQSYVAAVNRVGVDDLGHQYNGDSCVIDPGWNKVLYHKSHTEDTHTITLSKEHLVKVRKRLPFLQDQDPFTIP